MVENMSMATFKNSVKQMEFHFASRVLILHLKMAKLNEKSDPLII